MWTKYDPQKRPRRELITGPVTLTIGPHWSDDQRTQQQFSLYLVRDTVRPEEECLAEWPREAIAQARQTLDEFEAWMEGQS